jgi:ribonuclease R
MAKRIKNKKPNSQGRSRALKKAKQARQSRENSPTKKNDFLVNRDLLYRKPQEDFDTLVERFDYGRRFPAKVDLAAKSFLQADVTSEIVSRLDLRHEFIITIDGETAKDFDDAISLELVDGVFHLGVHIADVSHFVKQDSVLDQEARSRGTSVYLIDQVIPMLPEALSNNLCSLVQDEDRLTFSCLMTYDLLGNRLSYRFAKSVIKSKRRSTYTEIQKILDGEMDLGPIFAEKVGLYDRLKNILLKKRMAEGSVNIESDELFFEMKSGGKVKNIKPKERKESEKIIEEFMLAANRSAAEILSKAGLGIYRIHEAPDSAKLDRFLFLAARKGLRLDADTLLNGFAGKKANELNAIIEGLDDPHEKKLYSFLLLTSFMQARYSAENIGHYGLAFSHYSHFTSPIRRYPDLLAHRLIERIIKKSPMRYDVDSVAEIATQSSNLERKAVTSEREYHKVKVIRYLEEKIGDEFDVFVIGMINRGLFVRDLTSGVEGFVDAYHLERFCHEQVTYDENNLVFSTSRGKVLFSLGQKMRVKLLSVNAEKLYIDFRPVDGEASATGAEDKLMNLKGLMN